MTPPTTTEPRGYETRDVALRPVVIAGIGLTAVVVVSAVLMWLLFGALAEREARLSPKPNPLAESFGRQVPPEPRLQTDPRKDLERMWAEEDATLHSYGWVDRKAGVVRIPIERAMELTLQRGLPARTGK
jgi:hypothetical protein